MTYKLLAAIYLATRRFGDWQIADDQARWLAPDSELNPEYTHRILALCGLRTHQW